VEACGQAVEMKKDNKREKLKIAVQLSMFPVAEEWAMWNKKTRGELEPFMSR
jgi:hypothetical protein